MEYIYYNIYWDCIYLPFAIHSNFWLDVRYGAFYLLLIGYYNVPLNILEPFFLQLLENSLILWRLAVAP